MHLSHLFENLNAWYLNFDRDDRVGAMFRPGLEVESTRRTVRQSAADVQTTASLRADYERAPPHRARRSDPVRLAPRPRTSSAATARATRRARPCRSAPTSTRSTTRSRGARRPARDRLRDEPAAGVHFVVFNPTGDDFRRVRLAMDGILPGGVRLAFAPRSIGQGINSVFHATHRQNFLVPPRAHRSFPLSERPLVSRAS